MSEEEDKAKHPVADAVKEVAEEVKEDVKAAVASEEHEKFQKHLKSQL